MSFGAYNKGIIIVSFLYGFLSFARLGIICMSAENDKVPATPLHNIVPQWLREDKRVTMSWIFVMPFSRKLLNYALWYSGFILLLVCLNGIFWKTAYPEGCQIFSSLRFKVRRSLCNRRQLCSALNIVQWYSALPKLAKNIRINKEAAQVMNKKKIKKH